MELFHSNKIQTNRDFWNWFLKYEETFFNAIKERTDVQTAFFDEISPKLDELKEGIYFMAGMSDDNTAELILTPDGVVKNIVFVEELICAAPKLVNWKFTALKPPMHTEGGINMSGYTFDTASIHFCYKEHPNYPDEIDIIVFHKDYNETNEEIIGNGIYIFLDNFLGELNFVTIIDGIEVASEKDAPSKLIPIEKLKNFLIWREKEFIERYEGTRRNTENDNYGSFEGANEEGKTIFAVMNTDLLKWDAKASHPWILRISIPYEGKESSGMPAGEMYDLLDQFEEELVGQLKDYKGNLNVGRKTGSNERIIYFACKEFRKSSKAVFELSQKYASEMQVDYTIYKDKYWQSFRQFMQPY